jgi:hypothetical protein
MAAWILNASRFVHAKSLGVSAHGQADPMAGFSRSLVWLQHIQKS